MEEFITACTRDCPGACSIIASVDNDKVIKLRGNPDHDVTAGFLCKNTAGYLNNYFYSSKRILHPLLKENGKWKRITWDEALDIGASKINDIIKEHGSQAILYYQGFGARTALQAMNKRFFNILGGVTTTYGTVCGGIGHTAMEMDFGEKISHDPLDHMNSNLIIIWGRNPAVTDVHLWRIIRKSKRNGTKLVVIDPVKTKTANHADIFIQPTPGSDSYLAMAMAKIIMEKGVVDTKFIQKYTANFEDYKNIIGTYSLEFLSIKCGISLQQLNEIAAIYANNKPSSIITGWGLHRYIRGHLAFRMIDALAAITGNIGILGGGVSQGFEEYQYFDFSIQLNELGKNSREISMPEIGDEILNSDNPPIKLIFLASANPVSLNPNSLKVKEGFESADFVIMVDHFLNDTSDVADLFLPATTYLEEEDLIGSYGHSWIAPINPVISPQGEAKSEFEIFKLLAERLGFGDKMSGSPEKWLKKIASPILDQGINFEELQKAPQKMVPSNKVPFSDRKFKTESGRFEFIKEFNPEKASKSDYPLKLLSTMAEDFIGAVIPENEMVDGFLEVEIHPDILKKENIIDGDKALLESSVGSLIVKVKENSDLRKDFVLTYKGGWLKHNKCVNVLSEDIISEVGNGTPYYDTGVKIKKLD